MAQASRRVIPLLVLAAAFMVSQQLWKIRLLVDPLDVEVPAGAVELYGTTWCSYCARAREFLDTSGVPYADLDIEQSPSAEQAFRQYGGQGVPLIRIGDTIIHGFSPQQMRKALEALYPANSP